MNYRLILGIWLCCIVSHPGISQSNLFNEAFEEFKYSRLWEFEPIPVRWTMQGMLQADLNEGLNHLLENNPSLAETSLAAVLEKDSTIWQAYYYRAASRKQQRNFSDAEKDIRRALKLHPDFYEGLVELAKILYLRGNSLEGERVTARAIRIAPARGTAHYLKGDINMTQGNVHGAIRNYKACLAGDSLFHDARIKLALIDGFEKKNINASLVHLDKVLKYDSLQKSALLFRSLLVYEKNKKQAVQDLTNLITVSPQNLAAPFYRGLISAELGDYDKAFADLHRVIKATETDDNNFVGQQSMIDKKIDLQNAGAYTIRRLYGLSEEDQQRIKKGYCHILLHEYEKALTSLAKVSDFSKEPVAVFLAAVAYEHYGKHHYALQHYDAALQLDDDITEAHKKRGIYRQELKQWDASIDDFNAVLKAYPNSYFTNRMRGVSYYHCRRFREAVDDYSVYLENDSANQEIRSYRGLAYRDMNQRLNAYIDFAESGFPQLLVFGDLEYLVDSVLQKGDTTLALRVLEATTAAAPDFSEGYVQKFKIYLARNDWKTIDNQIAGALRHARQVLERSKHSFLLTLQGIAYLRKGHSGDAIRILSDAIKSDPKNDFAYLERGKVFLSMGKPSKARTDFQQAITLGNAQARKLLATVR